MKILIFLVMILPTGKCLDIIDHSDEAYVLIPMEQAYIYRDTGTVFHVFNITHMEQKFQYYSGTVHSNFLDPEDKKLFFLVDKCREYLDQLTIHRSKRGIDILGTIIKYITGMPDHDEAVMVENKLNDLIENNNRLAIVNQKLEKNIEDLTGHGGYHVELIFEWLAKELSEIIYTINLAKIGVLNTAILNLNEINQIIKSEKIADTPLMEVLEHSTFKIIQAKSIYVLLLKYPKIEQKCMFYQVRSIEKDFGKLQLEKFVSHCNDKFEAVKDCKKYVSSNICKYQAHSCTEELLNGRYTNCTVIRERMPLIEEIDNGKVIIHGTHKINNITKQGTYLLLFNETITVDDKNYTNDRQSILQYLKKNRHSQYDILDIIESRNEELKLPKLNIFEKIPVQIQNNPIVSTFIVVVAFVIMIFVVHYGIKICKIYNSCKSRKHERRMNTFVEALFNNELGTIQFNRERSQHT